MNRVRFWKTQEEIEQDKTDYVIKTSEEYNELVQKIRHNKNWQEPFIKLCRHYYEKNPSGGNLHIVLDDGNLENHNIDYCAGLAFGCQDHEALDIAELMQWMNKKQRKVVYENI